MSYKKLKRPFSNLPLLTLSGRGAYLVNSFTLLSYVFFTWLMSDLKIIKIFELARVLAFFPSQWVFCPYLNTAILVWVSASRVLSCRFSWRALYSFPARALRAQGLLLADGAPTVGWGKTFWPIGRVFLQKGPFLGNKKLKNQSEGAKLTVSARSTNGPLTKSRVL